MKFLLSEQTYMQKACSLFVVHFLFLWQAKRENGTKREKQANLTALLRAARPN